jgi:hypothetical protein
VHTCSLTFFLGLTTSGTRVKEEEEKALIKDDAEDDVDADDELENDAREFVERVSLGIGDTTYCMKFGSEGRVNVKT